MQIAGRFQTLQTLVMMTSHLRALEKTSLHSGKILPELRAQSEFRKPTQKLSKG